MVSNSYINVNACPFARIQLPVQSISTSISAWNQYEHNYTVWEKSFNFKKNPKRNGYFANDQE